MRLKEAAKPRSFDFIDAMDYVFNFVSFFSSKKRDTTPQKYTQPKEDSTKPIINIADLIASVSAYNNDFILYLDAEELVEDAKKIVIHGETIRDEQGTQYIKAPAFCDRYVAIDNSFMQRLHKALGIPMKKICICDTQTLKLQQQSSQSQRAI